MPKSKIITTATYDGLPIIASDKKSFQYSAQYLKNNKELLDNTIARHNKVMTFRADLKYPEGYSNRTGNADFSKAMQSYTKELSREGIDPQYVGKREQCISENPHFHIQMLVNGSEVKCYKPLVDALSKHWGNALNIPQEEAAALVWPCNKTPDGQPQKNGIMIRRSSEDFQQNYEAVFKQMSYIAKHSDKDVTPSSVKKVFYSQYKKGKSRSSD